MLSIGQKLQIEPINTNKQQNPDDTYFAKVTSIENNIFSIEQPISETTNKVKFFFEKTEFFVTFTTKNGGVFRFQTKSIRNIRDTVPLIELKIPEKYDRIQRRAFARVDVLTDVKILLNHSFTTTTLNVSGGGMSLLFPNDVKVDVDDEFSCELIIDVKNERLTIPIKCIVVRIVVDEQYEKYKVFVHFIDISESDRSKIVKFCFQKEVETRRMQLE